jgi:hypothetical protein
MVAGLNPAWKVSSQCRYTVQWALELTEVLKMRLHVLAGLCGAAGRFPLLMKMCFATVALDDKADTRKLAMQQG